VDYPNKLAFATRKDLDTLNIILSKAVNSITKTDKLNIYNNWLSHEVKPFYAEAKFLIICALILVGLITLVILFNLVLRKRVTQKTNELSIAKEKVEKNEKRFRSLMHNLETGIVVHAPDTSITMNNPRASELLGLSNDQMQGKVAIDPSWKFIAEDNLPLPLEEYPVNRILKLKKPIRSQILGIVKSSNNEVVWVLINGFPTWNDKGEIIEIVVSFFDITERKQTEQTVLDSKAKLSQSLVESNQSRHLLLSLLEDQLKAKETLRESNEYLESLFNFTTAPIVVWDHSLIITRFNRAFEQLSGFDAAEVIGQQVSILFPEDQVQSSLSFIKKTADGEQWDTVEIEILRKDKNTKIVVWNSSNIFDKVGKTIVATIALGYDITERKKNELALRDSEEKLSTLFSSMTEMVVMHEMIFSENGEAVNYLIIDCNNAFTTITGIKREDAIGKLATVVYETENPPYLSEYALVCDSGKSLEFHSFFAAMEKHFLISVISSGKNKFSTISTDITTNEQIHEIIKEKNKELENYIYVASHDLRSPLVNIQGFSQRLQKQTSQLTKAISGMNINAEIYSEFSKISSVDIPKSINFILNNVSKMDTLINGLLQLSRTGQIKLNVNMLDMNKLANKVVAVYNYQLTEFKAEVIVHNLVDCWGDENQINQLFSNIIGNAIKYRDKNRKLIIEISSQAQYNRVIYSIKDTGIGINQRHLERIWDVFYRVDASAAEVGEGLGLSLAKRIVDKHKGKIGAESVEGEGSTFFVELHRNNFEE
jgi:PAS domain S-box-containing protein